MENNQRANRLELLGDIVMHLLLHDPAFADSGDVIGDGENEIDVHDFVTRLLDVAGRQMNMTQTEFAGMIGSHVSNWNKWYRQNRQNRRLRPTEGDRTTWFINEIIRVRSRNAVRNGPPRLLWPLREE
jgi:hypothetical protein